MAKHDPAAVTRAPDNEDPKGHPSPVGPDPLEDITEAYPETEQEAPVLGGDVDSKHEGPAGDGEHEKDPRLLQELISVPCLDRFPHSIFVDPGLSNWTTSPVQ